MSVVYGMIVYGRLSKRHVSVVVVGVDCTGLHSTTYCHVSASERNCGEP